MGAVHGTHPYFCWEVLSAPSPHCHPLKAWGWWEGNALFCVVGNNRGKSSAVPKIRFEEELKIAQFRSFPNFQRPRGSAAAFITSQACGDMRRGWRVLMLAGALRTVEMTFGSLLSSSYRLHICHQMYMWQRFSPTVHLSPLC